MENRQTEESLGPEGGDTHPDLDCALPHEKAVGWLEISVDEAARMHVLQTLSDLEEYVHHLQRSSSGVFDTGVQRRGVDDPHTLIAVNCIIEEP